MTKNKSKINCIKIASLTLNEIKYQVKLTQHINITLGPKVLNRLHIVLIKTAHKFKIYKNEINE